MSVTRNPLSISVIVPVHEGGEAFIRCLSALRAAKPAPLEILVVADGAIPDDLQAAREAGVRAIELPVRAGPARARNVGARAARGEILLFVDADVLAPVDTLALVALAFDRCPAPAAIIGSYDAAPAGATFLSQYKNLQHHFVHQTGRERAATFWGACGAIRRATFLELGGFDERYGRPCVEDIEFGYRLCRAGKEIRLCHRLQVKHLKVWTPGTLLKTDFLYRALPWTELILRYRTVPNDLNLNWGGRLSALCALVLVGGLLGTLWTRWSLAPAAGAVIGLMLLNAPFYGLLRRRRGTWFALRAIPWHWFYYLYSLAGFALALLRHLLRIRRAPWLRSASAPPSGDLPVGTR